MAAHQVSSERVFDVAQREAQLLFLAVEALLDLNLTVNPQGTYEMERLAKTLQGIRFRWNYALAVFPMVSNCLLDALKAQGKHQFGMGLHSHGKKRGAVGQPGSLRGCEKAA